MSRSVQVVIILVLATSLLASSLPGLPADAQTTDAQDLQLSKVEEAIRRAQEHLFAGRNEDGYWDGNCRFYTPSHPDVLAITSQYVLFLNHLGINNEGKRRAVEYLVNSQRPDGSWGDPMSDYGAVLALEQAGLSPQSLVLQRAYPHVEQIEHPEKLMFVSVYDILADGASWEETDIPVIGDTTQFSEKRVVDFRMEYALAFSILRTLDVKGRLSREQRQLLKKAESFLLRRQLSDGSWRSYSQATILPLSALYELGNEKNDEPISRGLQFLASLQNDDGSLMNYRLPVFETALAMLALEASGVERDELQPAIQWLIDSRFPGGGWAHTPASSVFPDNDDTSLAAAVLADCEPAMMDGVISFIFSRQNEGGGWPSYAQGFEGEEEIKWRSRDVWEFLLADPSIPDVTGRALLALGKVGYATEDQKIAKAVAFLQRVQLDNGPWFGWWGVPYIYGTGAVLVGLNAVGLDMSAPFVQKAVQWLKSCQNADGGWGESLEARESPEYAGKGDSTATQASWAILGLLAAHEPPDSKVIEKGISYLLSHQMSDGSWEYKRTLLAGPSTPYQLEYGETIFGLWALAAYRNAIAGPANEPVLSDSRVRVLLGVAILLISLGLTMISFRRRITSRKRREMTLKGH